jgi:DNA-binding transcriptional LysR family regulator
MAGTDDIDWDDLRYFLRALEAKSFSGAFSLDILSGARPYDVRKGEADLAIRAAPLADQNLIASKLCEAGFSLYASATYLDRRPAPVDPNDLAGHDVIGYHASLSAAPSSRWIEKQPAPSSCYAAGK